MGKTTWHKLLTVLIVLLLSWVAFRFLLPVAIPFLLGGLIATAAEPAVRLLQKRLKLPRFAASGFCVSLTLLLFATVVSLVGAVAVRELGVAAKLAPAAGDAISQGLALLEDWLVGLAQQAPERLRPMLIQTVLTTFQDSTALVQQFTGKIPSAMAGIIGRLSKGLLTVGTGILAGFMISARLPRLRQWIKSRLPEKWTGQVLPALQKLRSTAGGWFRAQIKLMAVTWAVVSLGFLFLKIPNALLWAGAVALVDAVPVLGTGTVLVPWAIVKFLQQDILAGAGLFITYGVAWLVRSILEPRLVGKSLGIDPLLSLAAFYAGYRFWGVPGMIFAPMAAALIKGAAVQFTNNSQADA